MRFFREGLTEAGFELLPGEHPIIPVMLHDARRAAALAEALLAKGVYVIAFSYPVVPKGKARIRTQISATHTREELERAVAAFAEAGRAMSCVVSLMQRLHCLRYVAQNRLGSAFGMMAQDRVFDAPLAIRRSGLPPRSAWMRVTGRTSALLSDGVSVSTPRISKLTVRPGSALADSGILPPSQADLNAPPRASTDSRRMAAA